MTRTLPPDQHAPAREREREHVRAPLPPARPVGFAALLTLASVAAAFMLVAASQVGLPLPFTAGVPAAVAATGPAADSCTAGNVVVYAHSLVIAPNEWICGDADAYGGSVRVQGHVSGSVTAVGGSVVVSGEVDGDITAFGGSVTLLSGARVAGDVDAWGGASHVNPAAVVSGNVERSDRLASAAGAVLPSMQAHPGLPWPWVLGWSLLAAIIITLFPERTWRVRSVVGGAALRSGAVGLLTCVLGLGLAGLLFFTCIGIPISLLLLVSLLAAWVLGSVAAGLWLGERILRALAPGEHAPVLPAVVGMAVLAGAEIIPCVGGAVTVIAGCIGLGAALISRFGSARHALSLPAPVPPGR